MKRCPKCAAAYGSVHVVCRHDGARLPEDAAAPAASRTSSGGGRTEATAPPSGCASCGALEPDDGDGYCASCGHRLDARATVSLPPDGDAIGRWEIVAARGTDDMTARASCGASGLVALGDALVLGDEAAAARALAGRPDVPRVLDRGQDPRRGAYLVLSPPPEDARPLAEIAAQLDPRGALAVARRALDVAHALATSSMRWTPRAGDALLDARGGLVLARVRAAPLRGARVPACCALAVIGRALAPMPAVAGTPRLFRALTGPGCDAPHLARDVAQMRAELDEIDAEMERFADEPRHVAAECDGGLRRDHNDDAVALATGETNGERWTVLVVCDGVSCSSHAGEASTLAANTACETLAQLARAGAIAGGRASKAVSAAIRAAHEALCTARFEPAHGDPPGTTVVAGLVHRGRLTVGWVGDSRAYWIGAEESLLLTRDHSWAVEAVSSGVMTEREAMCQPLAHALTRCLGPLRDADGDAVDVEPDVTSYDLPGPGYVVLCSDGLWNYASDAEAITELVRPSQRPPGPAGVKMAAASAEQIARRLVNHALYRGGADNVSVAVLDYVPRGRAERVDA